MKNLNFNIKISIIANLIILPVGFMINYVWGNFVNPYIFGLYVTLISFVTIIDGLTLPGAKYSLILSSNRNLFENFKVVFKKKFLLSFLLCLLIFLLSLFFNKTKLFPSQDHFVLIQIVVLLIPFFTSLRIWENWLNGQSNLKLFYTFSIFQKLSLLLILIILISSISSKFLVLYFFLSMLIVHLIFFLITCYKFNNNFYDQEINKNTFKKSFLLNSLLPLEKIMFSFFLGVESAAVLAICLILPNFLRIIYDNSLKLFYPFLAQNISLNEKVNALLKQKKYIIILLLSSIIFGYFIETLINLFFKNYYEYSYLAKYLYYVFIIEILNGYVFNLMVLSNKSNFLQIFNFINVIVRLLLMIFLINLFDIDAFLISRFTVAILLSMYLTYILIQNYKFKFK